MAKNKKDEKNKYYPAVIIYKTMRASFMPVFVFLFFVMAGLVFQSLIREESWDTLIYPLLGIMVFICLFPLTEEWEYTPWQAKAQKYERQFKD